MFRFAFGKLGGLLACSTAFFAVASKPPEPRVRLRGTRGQRGVDRHRQRAQCLEVLLVRHPRFRLLPPLGHRLVVWRRRGPGRRREPLAMGRPQVRGRLAGGRAGSLGPQPPRRRGWRPAHRHDGWGTGRGPPPREARRAPPPRARRQGPPHLRALALAAGCARGRVAPPRPGVTPGAPRGPAGRIRPPAHAWPPRGGAPARGLCLLEPGWPSGSVARGRDPARRVPRTPAVGPSGAASMALGEDAQRAPEQPAEPDRVPTSRRTPPVDPPRATRPRVVSGWAATALGAPRRAGRPGGPGPAAETLAARPRARPGGGSSAHPTPPRARGAPAGRVTRSGAALSAPQLSDRRPAAGGARLCRWQDGAVSGYARVEPPREVCRSRCFERDTRLLMDAILNFQCIF
jgi:hypothetical protein